MLPSSPITYLSTVIVFLVGVVSVKPSSIWMVLAGTLVFTIFLSIHRAIPRKEH